MLVRLLFTAFAMSAPAAGPESSLVMLAAGGREIGISPRLAGRVVLFRKAGGSNALLADPATWTAAEQPPRLAPDAEWKAYNGHIVWIGPQGEWWAHQELDPAKRSRKDNWPPDPWGEYAAFTVEQRAADAAVLLGPPSPVTGLRLRKEVRLGSDGTAHVTVVARNTRNAPVTWDLWSNTRLLRTDRVFVAAGPATKIRVEHNSSSPWTQAALAEAVVDGWFTFRSDEPPPAGCVARVAKAFLTPDRAVLAAFGDGQVFVKRFVVTPADRLAPDQAAVEIFQNTDPDPVNGLLELEGHGPLTTLQPGEEMTFAETWTLLDAPRVSDDPARAAWLNQRFPPESAPGR